MKLVRSNQPVVAISGLHKSYGDLPVLTGVDLDIQHGEVTAVIGPNGAGKTTLIKCVLGLISADSGQIHVGGSDVSEGIDYRRLIGYMPQKASFPENLTGRDVLRLVEKIRGEQGETARSMIRLLDLEKDLEKPVRTLSGGTLQKLSATLAFMFDPGCYILDEPTAGLDPISSSRLKDYIADLRDKGAAVVMTSHVMADLEELCDRVVFLLDGKIRFDGSLSSILRETGKSRLERAIAHLLNQEAA